MLIKLDDGRLKDVPLTEVNAENYIVPDGEECSWHCIIEIVKFSPSTGKRLSVPRVQKFDDKIWHSIMERQLKLQGYTVTILHDPTKAIREKANRIQQMKDAVNAAKRKSQEEREKEFQNAVAEAVAKEIAKLNKISKGKKDANNGSSKG